MFGLFNEQYEYITPKIYIFLTLKVQMIQISIYQIKAVPLQPI
jgi:hypothetical protein